MRVLHSTVLLLLALLFMGSVCAEPSAGVNNTAMHATELDAIPAETIALIESNGLWDKIRRSARLEFDPNHPRVIHERQRYLDSPEYLTLVTQRAEPFLYHIVESLEEENLPLELALLPIIESAYISNAKSKSGAAGLWQFIPATGQTYGLKRTHWYDGRQDVRASTRAAIQYLKKLYSLFDGDWLLVLAAYNAGENNILRAMDRNLDQGKHLDFWHMKLREETARYVPRFLAVLSIIQSPAEYGIDLWPVEDSPFFTKIKANKKTSLQRLAKKMGVEPQLLKRLNAGLRKKMTPPRGQHEVLVPLLASIDFHSIESAQWGSDTSTGTTHRVARGETLSQISRRYDISVTRLKTNNNLRNDLIRAGQTLMIPES